MKGGEETISHAKEFWIIYVDTPRGRDINPHSLSTGCTDRLPSKNYNLERGMSNNFPLQKHEKLDLSQVSEVNVNSDESCRQHVPLIGCEENGSLLLWSSSKNIWPQSNHEKNIRWIPIEGSFTKYLTYTPQTCQGHQKQGKSERPSQPRGAHM